MTVKKTTKRTPLTATKTKKLSTTRTPVTASQSTKTVASRSTQTAPKSRVVLSAKGPAYNQQDVATRAYFLSLERGGNPDENWKLAEAEFQAGLWA